VRLLEKGLVGNGDSLHGGHGRHKPGPESAGPVPKQERGAGLAPRGLLRLSASCQLGAPASVRQQRQSLGGTIGRADCTAKPSRGVRGDESPRRGSGLAPRGRLRRLNSYQLGAPASVRQQRQSLGGTIRRADCTAKPSRGVRGDESPRRGPGLAPRGRLRRLNSYQLGTPASVRQQRQSLGGTVGRADCTAKPSRGVRGWPRLTHGAWVSSSPRGRRARCCRRLGGCGRRRRPR
jgi:hypothetical protein